MPIAPNQFPDPINATSFIGKPMEPMQKEVKIWIDGRKDHKMVNLLPKGYGYSKKDPYWFDLDRCTTKLELFHWVHHLLEKEWFTSEVALDFIAEISKHYNWGYI